ncbi:MAG: hypothetical protein JSS36_00185 [Proteobacteria bacterium]|nr:hypothetical protein [Pseudomonadota bacterium]
MRAVRCRSDQGPDLRPAAACGAQGDGIAPLGGTMAPQPQTLFPIYQTQLGLRDAQAAIRECVKWLAKRSRAPFPPGAFDGAPFKTSLDVAAPAEAVVGTLGEAQYWAAKLRVQDSAIGGRSWNTEIVIRLAPDPAMALRLGARDSHERFAAHPPHRTVPGVLRQIVDHAGATDAGHALTDDIVTIDHPGIFHDLVMNPARNLPVLAFGAEACEHWADDIADSARSLAGAVIVAAISREAHDALASEMSKQASVYGRFARFYYPVREGQSINPYAHRLIRLDDHDRDSLHADIVELAAGVRATRDRRLPRMHEIELETSAGGHSGKAEEYSRRLSEVEEDLRSAEDLLNGAEEDVRILQAQLAESEAKNRTLRAESEDAARRIHYLRDTMHSLIPYEPLASPPSLKFKEFIEEWCAIASANMIIPSKAFLDSWDAIPDDATYLYRVRTALIGIINLTANRIQLNGRNIALGDGVELCPVGKTAGFDDYDFTHEGRQLRSDWHAKWGNGADIRNAFRIYFDWDTESEQSILQVITTHLTNRRTN